MRKEIEDHWRLIKEGYPNAVVFYECDGLFFVKESDTNDWAEDYGLAFSGSWVGFDGPQARRYMYDLAGGGLEVIRASPIMVARVDPPADKSKRIARERRDSSFIALDATALFGRETLEGYPVSVDSFAEVCRGMENGDGTKAREIGDVYVFEVDGWYEIDYELTSMPLSRVVLIAKAAFVLGVKVPCRLVLPRAWRRRRTRRRATETSTETEAALPIGQLKLAGFD